MKSFEVTIKVYCHNQEDVVPAYLHIQKTLEETDHMTIHEIEIEPASEIKEDRCTCILCQNWGNDV